jgi:membrane-bound lytic murein transglycosylase D
MNGLKKRQPLKPGGSLLVPAPATGVAIVSAPEGRGGVSAKRAQAPATRHLVKRGETVTQIARVYGVSIDDLQRANGLSRNASLRAGQTLSVPGSAAKHTPSSTQKNLANSVARPLASSGERRYTVKPGDTLTAIARAHKVSVADLRRWNDLPPDEAIQPGQKLRILEAAS